MDRKTGGLLLLVAGAVVALAGLLADTIGLGEGTGIGYKQIAAVVVGVVAAIFGARAARGG